MSEAYLSAEQKFCSGLNAIRKTNSNLPNMSKDRKEAAIIENGGRIADAEKAFRQLELEVAMIDSTSKH
jgi:hypothetical protein